MYIIARSRENYPAANAIFPAVKHLFTSFSKMFLNVVRRLLFIYLFRLFTPSLLSYLNWKDCKHLIQYKDCINCIASSILQAQWPAVFVLHVCEIMNLKLHISDGWNIIASQCREKERKMMLRPLVSWSQLETNVKSWNYLHINSIIIVGFS